METTSTVSLYWIIFAGTVLLSWIVQVVLQSKFKKYSKIRITAGLSGAEVARRMLRENGIDNVEVTSVRGRLTDHYNPITRTINLSDGVYNSNSIMAAAVAAHECGHALQHAKGYVPLKMRSALVPVVSFASQWVMWVILAGMLVINTFPQLMLLGIILFALTTLFSLITLPVEINASKRALVWLNDTGITNYETHPMAKDALKSAAYTYFVAAISSLATLFYYITLFSRRR
ncbi:MAG: putative neutral zinc metallopeptidase [Bacteroidetes bacterium ADurb.Bin037]|nr:MAG: putative neutral zinc metallopeptidase [Bacteroidetes bacterium ADurb.Bin037]HPW77684.1 zinc metallopeptidase [Bacteroidales bacterium]HQB55509.1 zinc metallopeptidase [Bacteroidales bacterium]